MPLYFTLNKHQSGTRSVYDPGCFKLQTRTDETLNVSSWSNIPICLEHRDHGSLLRVSLTAPPSPAAS